MMEMDFMNNGNAADGLPVSEEMLGAWLEGNLSADENRMMDYLLENDSELASLAESVTVSIEAEEIPPAEQQAIDMFVPEMPQDYAGTRVIADCPDPFGIDAPAASETSYHLPEEISDPEGYDAPDGFWDDPVADHTADDTAAADDFFTPEW